jgi:hypothetical protein
LFFLLISKLVPAANPDRGADGQSASSDSILVLRHTASNPAKYFMATNGSDSNDGTINNPWQSLEYSLSKLIAGDTLYLRGGIYYEQAMDIRLRGTVTEPVLIQSYPGELAEISGGIADFRQINTGKWTLADGGINLYKSVQAYEHKDYMNAWLTADDLHLITYGETTDYDSWDNLTSENYGPIKGFDPIFVGPGILQHADGHLYIRLENNPNDLIDHNSDQLDPVPADSDPNNHEISVFFTEKLITMVQSGYIIFKDINFSHAGTLFDVEDNTNNIEFAACRFNYGRYGFVLRSAGASNFTVQNCEFNNGLPDNVYWCDVKNRDSEVHEAYPEFQSAAIHGEMPGFLIRDNLFRDSFDAIFIDGYTENTKIENNDFIRLRDDAISLGLVTDVEISDNLMWYVGAGVSCAFDTEFSPNNGDVYIHHNIIDFSFYQHGGREGNYREDHWPVWQIIHAFSNHEESYGAWWKVYNNTAIGRKSGYMWNPAGLPDALYGNVGLFVYNNIFFVKDDRIIFSDHQESSGAHYDGNVVFRLNPEEPERFTLFYNFGNGENYTSLDDFRANSGTAWEQKGLETDPQFDLTAVENPVYIRGQMRKRYTPDNPAIFTEGVSYSGLNWPGTLNINYRGALGSDIPTNGNEESGEVSAYTFSLEQNYPNPFNPGTLIRFSLAKPGKTTLRLYNIQGKLLKTIWSEYLSSGMHKIHFNAGNLPSGTYIYQLISGPATASKKMILIR